MPAGHRKSRKTQITILEIALLELLVALARARLHAPRQMHLAVFSDQHSIGSNEHGRIEALAFVCQLGIPDVKTDAEPARSIEQRLDIGVGYRAFKEDSSVASLTSHLGKNVVKASSGKTTSSAPLAAASSSSASSRP